MGCAGLISVVCLFSLYSPWEFWLLTLDVPCRILDKDCHTDLFLLCVSVHLCLSLNMHFCWGQACILLIKKKKNFECLPVLTAFWGNVSTVTPHEICSDELLWQLGGAATGEVAKWERFESNIWGWAECTPGTTMHCICYGWQGLLWQYLTNFEL